MSKAVGSNNKVAEVFKVMYNCPMLLTNCNYTVEHMNKYALTRLSLSLLILCKNHAN